MKDKASVIPVEKMPIDRHIHNIYFNRRHTRISDKNANRQTHTQYIFQQTAH
jgi:hypothetical protein